MAPIHQGIVASVIGRSTLPVQQTVLLNKGERDGLSLESVIVHPSGVIGRVMALYPTTCLVMLLTDPDSRVAGLVERSRETGLLVGRGRGLCELIYLDARADINEGDQIVTAGLAGSFLKGVPLGTVTRVVRDEPSGSLSAFVAPAAHVSRLEDVLCLPARQ
ncbi:MAG: rod shape-determining protein MreC [Candidatus Omnitrophica bacterium]|nr:rod shape-determining protein MreC [Candidatus Omnitrophota bacterium]